MNKSIWACIQYYCLLIQELMGDMDLNLQRNEGNCNFTPLCVRIRVLNRTISQLLSVMEDDLEKSKYDAFEVISTRTNHLIDCLSRDICLTSKSETKIGDLKTINIDVYQKLLNTLVDITLVTSYNMASNEIGLLHECINLLNIVEKEILCGLGLDSFTK